MFFTAATCTNEDIIFLKELFFLYTNRIGNILNIIKIENVLTKRDVICSKNRNTIGERAINFISFSICQPSYIIGHISKRYHC